ncbi:curli production assembly/transport component CsgF [Marivirga arenosa]|uniref:Curli production assembly/transport component CsgF n=1 Tax=Marivirga arenosa TaxID=3059076 RepID=A0AA49GEJ7_9BACT|nr:MULTISPECIES: curli production assembly/transport component CsgF [unclassified Marivirga]WKK80621.2 curli assembly protein CsgF [Marivirga sp. BKB1-2]WKK84399.1 curli assembly protein CsgF [Marivirga sp. ABR2-2]
MKKLIAILFILFGAMNMGLSQDFVYKPINPAFGGDTFNYQWLLSSASEQNDFKEESDIPSFQQDPLSDFENSINRQILSQLSRELVSNLFGEEGIQDGTFEIGSFQIEILSSIEGINITIFDTTDGAETQIIVPYY